MADAPDRVSSDLRSPVVAAIYLLLFPIWALLFLNQLGSTASTRTVQLVAYGFLALLALLQFVRGLALARQRVEADAAGLRLLGPAGFSVPWGDIESLRPAPRQRSGTVILTLRPGHTVTSDMLLGRVKVRRFGVQPEVFDALLALASTHGVRDR